LYNEPVNKFVAGFIGSPPMNFLEVKVEAEGSDIFVNEGSFRLKVNEKQAKSLKSYVGKPVTFGIRPEDVQYAEKNIPDFTITGVVTVVEPLGSETHVYVSTSKAQVVGKIAPEFTVKPNNKISLIPDLDHARFFDFETELAIL
jgi:multiple sugar transport system ATP-binding protein